LETLYLEENELVEDGRGAVALKNVLESTFRLKVLFFYIFFYIEKLKNRTEGRERVLCDAPYD